MNANWILWFYVANFLPNAVGLYALGIDIWPCVFLNLLVLTTGSIAGLACVWATLGRPHWFWRLAVVGVVASLPLLIPAYELLIWFFSQAVVTIPPLLVVRRYKDRRRLAEGIAPEENTTTARRWLQWSIRDQLLWCVLLSCIIAAAVQIPSRVWASWFSLVLLGLVFGVCTLAGTWAAFSRRRLWMRLAVICLFPFSALIACWLGIFKTYRERSLGKPSRPWRTRLVRVGLPVYSILLLVPPAAVFCLLVQPVPVPVLPELPDPNGYDDLVRAGKAVDSALTALSNAGNVAHTIWDDPWTGSDVEMRALTSATAAALAIARLGLDKPCQVPFSYSNPFACDHLSSLRTLAIAFAVDGVWAEREGRMADAAGSYMDVIRTGYGISRGGHVTDDLTGQALLMIGSKRLRSIRSKLKSTQCTQLAQRIYQLDSEAESWVEIRDREAAYDVFQFGWQGRVSSWIDGSERMLRDNHGSVAKTRLLICSLALQAFYQDHDAWPESLAVLTPGYLPDVPEDPFTGAPVVYRRAGSGYWLYCLPPETADWHPERRSTLNFSYDGSDE